MFLWMVWVAVVVVLAWCIGWFWTRERLPGIPGPPKWPILGNVAHISPQQLLKWAHSYGGVYKVWIFAEELVVVTGQEAITEVCQRKAKDFEGRPNRYRNKILSLNYSDLCFTKGCERVWWTRRFVEQNMTEHMGGARQVDNITHSVIRSLVKKFAEQASDTVAFNPQPLIVDTSLQVLHAVMFRERLGTGSRDLATLRRINALTVEALGFEASGVLLDRFPLARFFPGCSKTYSACKESVELYVELYRKLRARCLQEDGEVGGVVRHLIKQMVENNPMDLTDDNIVTLIQNLLIAGNMNISSLMSSLLNIMVHYPRVQAEVQKEADEVVGRSRQISMADEPHMVYTQAVVLELLRFAHPTPFGIERRSVNNSSLCGFSVPKDTNVILNLWGHHHHTDLWSDPFRFKPERFLNSDGDLLPPSHPSRRHLLPFGLGARMCVGARMGLQHLFLMTATILHNFHVLPADSELRQPSCDPRTMLLGIVMMPQDYTIRVRVRNPDSLPSDATSSTGDIDSTS